jgi:hypothetical protein
MGGPEASVVQYLYKGEAERALGLYRGCPIHDSLDFLFDNTLDDRARVIRMASFLLMQRNHGLIALFGGFIQDHLFSLKWPGRPGELLPIKDLDAALQDTAACREFLKVLKRLFEEAEESARGGGAVAVGAIGAQFHNFPRHWTVRTGD